MSWITIRNFGFSGAADVFVFISGYTASITYASIMLERGILVGVTRVFKRAWQLYAAYIVLFAIYIVTIGDVAARYAAPDIFYEFNIAGLVDQPIRIIGHGLLLQSRALNLDVLQLCILLMGCFPGGVMDDAAQARLDDGRIHRAVFCCPHLRMEFVVLSRWRLVFQSILLATSFCVRRLVCASAGKAGRFSNRRSWSISASPI